MQPVDPELLQEAVDLGRQMGEITLGWFGSPSLHVDPKADGTPVTQADRAAERFLREEISKRFPADGVLGEEEPPTAGSSGRTWIVDPIDGTKAFVRGVPLYSSLLAVFDEEGPAVGVIHLPALGKTVYAGRGLGCYLDGSPAAASSEDTLGHGCVCTSGLDTWSTGQIGAVLDSGAQLRTWGDGYGFALVATGKVDAMVDPVVSLWDIAPMPVILSEAGGTFTDLSGSPEVSLDAAGSLSGVASNGKVHDQLLDLLARSLGS